MGDQEYALTAKAMIRGAIREPGFRFHLKEGERGPMRSVTNGPTFRDEPLYVPVDPLPEREEPQEEVPVNAGAPDAMTLPVHVSEDDTDAPDLGPEEPVSLSADATDDTVPVEPDDEGDDTVPPFVPPQPGDA